MNRPTPPRHGRLTHARISIADAVRFLTKHTTAAAIPTDRRTALGITSSATGAVVAVALISRNHYPGGKIAEATIAWTAPTARMRTMLLDAVYWRAAAMGYRIVLVRGDDRDRAHRVDIMYPLAAPRRTRPATGRQITRHLYGRPDNDGACP